MNHGETWQPAPGGGLQHQRANLVKAAKDYLLAANRDRVLIREEVEEGIAIIVMLRRMDEEAPMEKEAGGRD
ncbi:hypothetical protein [Luteolibacter luteus]|uniref:Uncharacterized protein n=1 Tax=Luteolibacter luteus TaxID=2728835 RepID=A0A858RC92_9BACT|nr:hypothetical protein [Luteolibacter luteus]QJE94261.1 hypothetical protein HHL09_00160 [Luteolibacter luteus]